MNARMAVLSGAAMPSSLGEMPSAPLPAGPLPKPNVNKRARRWLHSGLGQYRDRWKGPIRRRRKDERKARTSHPAKFVDFGAMGRRKARG